MVELKHVGHISHPRDRMFIQLFAVELSEIMIVVRVHIDGSGKPFCECLIETYSNTRIFSSSDIATPHDRSMTLLLKGFSKIILGIAIVQGCGQHVLIRMGELN